MTAREGQPGANGASEAGTALLERGAELSRIDALIGDALSDRGRLLMIEGPAGLGKTRLLEASRDVATASMRALSATASEFEREFPFGVVHQLFSRTLADDAVRERVLGGAAQTAEPVFATAAPAADAASGLSFAVLNGLYWMASNLADEYPLMLAIDDVQYCDEQSLRFLSYLARRLDGLPVLVAATWRSTDPGTNPGLIAELAHGPDAVVLAPGPLTEAGTGELIEAHFGTRPDDAFTRACAEATGGNPLLVTELLTALGEDGIAPDSSQVTTVQTIGPRALSRTVFARLSRLPAESIEVARAVSVLGNGAALPTLAALTGLDETQIATAARELERVGILRPGEELSFSHGLIRDAVYADLPAADRQLAHTRAAVILRESQAPLEAVAAQLLHTTPPGDAWTAEVLIAAGGVALESGGAAAAAAYLERALREPLEPHQRSETLIKLGFAQAPISGAAASAHLIEAFDETADPIARGRIAVAAAEVLATGSPERSQAVLREALLGLPEDETDLRDELQALELASEPLGDAQAEWAERVREYRRPPERANNGGLILAATAAWDWAETGGEAEEVSELARMALADGKLFEINNNAAAMALWAVIVAEHPAAEPLAAEGVERARRKGSLIAVASFESTDSIRRRLAGDLPGTEEALLEARDNWDLFALEDRGPAGYFAASLALVELGRGNVEAARHQLEGEPAPRSGSSLHRIWLNSVIEVLVAEGRYEKALDAAAEYRAIYPRITNPFNANWRSLSARALHALGRDEEAIAIVGEEVELARAFGAPGALARSLREAAEIQGSTAGLAGAVDIAERSVARLELARSLAAYGSALRRERKATEAREPLRRALELAAACGADGLVEHVRSEIYASGARPRRDALSGLESLTASERRVAELAATGASNREIAQELYVTTKTVELHLTNTYRKLDLRSRRELPTALAEARAKPL